MSHGDVAELPGMGTCRRRQPAHPAGTMAARLRWLADMCDGLPERTGTGTGLDPALEAWLGRIADLVLPAPPGAFGESALVGVQAHERGGRPAVPRARSSAIEVVLLGRFSVTVNGVDATPVRGNGAMLVKLLALKGAATVDDIVDRLWPDVGAVVGHARLRNTLSRLRKHVGRRRRSQQRTARDQRDARVDAADFLAAARTATSGPRADRVDAARLRHRPVRWRAAPRRPLLRVVRRRARAREVPVPLGGRRGESRPRSRPATSTKRSTSSRWPRSWTRSTRRWRRGTAALLVTLGRPAGARRALDRAWWVSRELGVPPSRELIDLTARVVERAAG